MRTVLGTLGLPVEEIAAPGTLDGGDVCDADGHFLIGLSERTNEEGARGLTEILSRHGFTAEMVDVRGLAGVLHLKTGLSSLGGGTLLAIDALRGHPAVARYRLLRSEEHTSELQSRQYLVCRLLLEKKKKQKKKKYAYTTM